MLALSHRIAALRRRGLPSPDNCVEINYSVLVRQSGCCWSAAINSALPNEYRAYGVLAAFGLGATLALVAVLLLAGMRDNDTRSSERAAASRP